MKGMRVVWVTALLLELLVALVMMLGQDSEAQATQPEGFAQAPQLAQAQPPPTPVPAAPASVPAKSFAEVKTLAAQGRLDQALIGLNELAKALPEEAGVERLRGIVLYQKEDLAGAEAAFARAATPGYCRSRIPRNARHHALPARSA